MKPLLSESELQQHVVKLLDAYKRPDVCYHHPANGEARHVTIGRKLKRMGVKKGVADLMLTVRGKSIALELKTEIGTQSKEQAEWQEEFKRAGGEYILARGLNEAINILIDLDVFLPGISFSSPSDGRGARWESGGNKRHSPNTQITSEPVTP